MTKKTRRQLVDRKIVDLLVTGRGVNAIAQILRVSKRRIRSVREEACARGYLASDGGTGAVSIPAYPAPLFQDKRDGRSERESEVDAILSTKAEWIRECLETGWHAVSVFEELNRTGVSRSGFYRYLQRHKLTRLGDSGRVIPEIIHRPGEAMQLDWGKLRDVADPSTGTKRTLWVFAGVLGFSRYLMTRLVWTMDMRTTLMAVEHFLRTIQGVPARLTIDNPKCIAQEASYYEPLLNPVVERFAAHYGMVVECLPPREPQLKKKIERLVPYIRRLYEAHGDRWEGLEESQAYLDRKLVLANQRRHGTTQQRPVEQWAEERKALSPLPPTAYEMEEFHEGIVRRDGHVRFDNKYYSVSDEHIGQSLVVLASSRQVSLYHAGTLLEVHDRITDPNQSKSTKPHHLKPWERDMRNDESYRQRARALGPHAEAMVEKMLRRGTGLLNLRQIWGLLSLDKRYGAAQIDEACGRALAADQTGYRAVRKWLEWREMIIPFPVSAPPARTPSPAIENVHARPLSVYQDVVADHRPSASDHHHTRRHT